MWELWCLLGRQGFFQCLNTIPEYRGFNSVGLLLGSSSKDLSASCMPYEMGQILAANETITVDMPGPGRTLLTYADISGIDCFHRFYFLFVFLVQ